MKTKDEKVPMLASELFAQSQSSLSNMVIKKSNHVCHWCSGPCDQTWRHDEPPPIPYQKNNKSLARCPGNPFICWGCWMWRRPKVSVFFLDGSYKDSQTASSHSWYITDNDAKAVNSGCKSMLHSTLLKPPNRFILSLRDVGCDNHLHLSVANDISIIEANTPLKFTINNIESEYTVYDLETALKDKDASRSPGVSALIRWFSPWDVAQVSKVRPVGKPPEVRVTDNVKKIIQKSGN